MAPRRRARFALALLVPWLLATASCYKLERRSRQADAVPPALLGAWRGDWQSDGNAGGGTVQLMVQSFQGQPVLQLDTLHPCLTESGYQFEQSGPIWRLLLHDVPVFEAVLDVQNRQLAGVYACAADQGVWSVAWDRELPQIADLSGQWSGSFASVQPALLGEFTMELQQTYDQGRLVLTGVLRVPQAGLELPFDDGGVVWRENGFDLFLQSGAAPGAVALLQGRGDPRDLSVRDGLMIIEDPRVPFRLALWGATPVR